MGSNKNKCTSCENVRFVVRNTVSIHQMCEAALLKSRLSKAFLPFGFSDVPSLPSNVFGEALRSKRNSKKTSSQKVFNRYGSTGRCWAGEPPNNARHPAPPPLRFCRCTHSISRLRNIIATSPRVSYNYTPKNK
jgi:hypothetical protein